MRIENKSPTGFRLAWDLPESDSCYGASDIVIILTNRESNGKIELKSFEISSTATFFDVLRLNPGVKYDLGLQIKTKGGMAQAFGQDLSVRKKNHLEEFLLAPLSSIVVGFGCNRSLLPHTSWNYQHSTTTLDGRDTSSRCEACTSIENVGGWDALRTIKREQDFCLDKKFFSWFTRVCDSSSRGCTTHSCSYE
ncbi:hypothetical protein MAR_006122 [Mya arenaria]|uniref:Fibronectin type-III domain-containing protein n=1 Tax=Mya arenaria TaxID=6604 RepID=A0ABY7DAL5_MYAAR|nr:hypothetical protein MAR_006122 [Mya arenaria]